MKRYYIPGIHGIVCVHEQTDTHVITGNVTRYYKDAKTNTKRYVIPIDKFFELKPQLIDPDNVLTHPSLIIDDGIFDAIRVSKTENEDILLSKSYPKSFNKYYKGRINTY
jgi:hypothetical protein